MECNILVKRYFFRHSYDIMFLKKATKRGEMIEFTKKHSTERIG